MKVLHILRSEPDEQVKCLMEAISEGNQAEEVRLYEGEMDYQALLELIFNNEKVFSWW